MILSLWILFYIFPCYTGQFDHVITAACVFVNDNECNNPLIWWKTKQLKFPTVAKLAKKYLGIPATSASSERIFSKARRIITGDRNRLAPEIAGTLFYINDNLEWYERQQ